jgi:hypothetical protein
MPALLWVAFWSTMMGAAGCFGSTSRPTPAEPPKRTD